MGGAASAGGAPFSVYYLTLKSGPGIISLNDYFSADFSEWSHVRHMNLGIKKANKMTDIKRLLSYRHNTQLCQNDKYLTFDSLQFLANYPDLIEGTWIDCLCIRPAGQTQADAFVYMGKLYSYYPVIPFWIWQPIEAFGLTRAWIFQEYMFTAKLMVDHPHINPENMKHAHKLRELLHARTGIVLPVEKGVEIRDALLNAPPQLNLLRIISKLVEADICTEDDVPDAFFGVLGAKFPSLNQMPTDNGTILFSLLKHGKKLQRFRLFCPCPNFNMELANGTLMVRARKGVIVVKVRDKVVSPGPKLVHQLRSIASGNVICEFSYHVMDENDNKDD